MFNWDHVRDDPAPEDVACYFDALCEAGTVRTEAALTNFVDVLVSDRDRAACEHKQLVELV